MNEHRVGIREFRARFSHYLRRAKAGERVIITERGQPVGQLTIPLSTTDKRTQNLLALGLAQWNGEQFAPGEPEAVNAGERTLADLVSEERERSADLL